ncbi:merozoite surface protein 7 [Plasmodium reichenowi]|uniref:Merozoite surface protein 7 n=1 Tax=Plasmodium reichenowi TaxID=5854 RepID=A0A2P9DLS8_PLARE|nr:merozoite surface protein 7 [Plasmodium reichenowi]
MKSNIIFYFSFFFVYLYYVSCNQSTNSTPVNNDEDQEELYIKNKKLEKLKNIVSGDFVGNYKNNEELLNKKIEEVQNSKEKNVHVLINGNSIIDEIEKNEENDDNEENNDDDNTYELDMNDDTFLGQNNDSHFENVDDDSEENEQEDEDKEKSESFPLFQNLGLFGKNVLSKVKAQSETVSQPKNEQEVQTTTQRQNVQTSTQVAKSTFEKDPTKKLYNLGDVLNHIVHISNKENKINIKNYGEKYPDFKKEYEDFVLNSKEYDIIKNLIIMFGQEDNKSNNGETGILGEAKHMTEIFIKLLDDEKYHQQFKNFIYGVYSYAKQNSHLSEKKIKPENEYKKFLEYSFNLLNTM